MGDNGWMVEAEILSHMPGGDERARQALDDLVKAGLVETTRQGSLRLYRPVSIETVRARQSGRQLEA